MQTIFVIVRGELCKIYVADDACCVERLLMKCYVDEKTAIGHFITNKIQTLEGHLHTDCVQAFS